jgi:hypothetical protein
MPHVLAGVGRVVRRRGPARPEQQPQIALGRHQPDPRLRELVAERRPSLHAVEVDLVRMLDLRVQIGDADDGEVVALDLEGVGGAAENLYPAGLVGLDPHRGIGLAHMSQEWTYSNLGHPAMMPDGGGLVIANGRIRQRLQDRRACGRA